MIEPGTGEIVKFVGIKILKEEVMVVDEVAERRRVTAVREREQRFAAEPGDENIDRNPSEIDGNYAEVTGLSMVEGKMAKKQRIECSKMGK